MKKKTRKANSKIKNFREFDIKIISSFSKSRARNENVNMFDLNNTSDLRTKWSPTSWYARTLRKT